MGLDIVHFLSSTVQLERVLALLGPSVAQDRLHAGVLAYHLGLVGKQHSLMVVLLGGTGAGKSTLLNRLMGREISATSFLRTFTTGAVAAKSPQQQVPEGFLAEEHQAIVDLPAQGEGGALLVATLDATPWPRLILVDTPDVDGDKPEHRSEADKAFRYADAVIFLVTPEKYQMTELTPYYRMAGNYALPALFVMNKAEQREMVEDYLGILEENGHKSPRLFAVARDDAGYAPPVEQSLKSMRQALEALEASADWENGLVQRAKHLVDRVKGHLKGLDDQRMAADRLSAKLQELVQPQQKMDVSPLLRDFKVQMRNNSVLYLTSATRIMDWGKSLAKKGRSLLLSQWRHPQPPASGGESDGSQAEILEPPLSKSLREQFIAAQNSMENVLLGDPYGKKWITQSELAYQATKLPVEDAKQIYQTQMDRLQQWMNQRRDATPRDTEILMKLLRLLPGGKKLIKWTEAAPWLMIVILVTHGAFFGHWDVPLIGGYYLFNFLAQRFSDEVKKRARQANSDIEADFVDLNLQQVRRIVQWINQQVPSHQMIEQLRRAVEDLSRIVYGQPENAL